MRPGGPFEPSLLSSTTALGRGEPCGYLVRKSRNTGKRPQRADDCDEFRATAGVNRQPIQESNEIRAIRVSILYSAPAAEPHTQICTYDEQTLFAKPLQSSYTTHNIVQLSRIARILPTHHRPLFYQSVGNLTCPSAMFADVSSELWQLRRNRWGTPHELACWNNARTDKECLHIGRKLITRLV